MAAPEKQVSPEEKLLKVIQSGGTEPSSSTKETPAKAPARTTASPAPKQEKAAPAPSVKPEKAPPVAKQDAKSKLKVAASDQTASASPKPADPAAAKPATPAAHAVGAAPARKRPKRKVNLRTVNSSLAAIVLVMLCLLGYEIWAAIETNGQDTRVVIPRLPGGGTQDMPRVEPVLSSNVLEKFAARPIFGTLAPTSEKTGTTTPTTAWILYAKDNLKLAAFIGDPGAAQKAVIIDKKLNDRMIFVRPGDKITAGDQDVNVLEFQSDKVILSDGAQKQAVK
jgi:hypothetical protein